MPLACIVNILAGLSVGYILFLWLNLEFWLLALYSCSNQYYVTAYRQQYSSQYLHCTATIICSCDASASSIHESWLLLLQLRPWGIDSINSTIITTALTALHIWLYMGNPTTMHTILQGTAWTLILIWDLSRTWYFSLYPATNQIYCNYFERSHEPESRVAIYQLRLQDKWLREYRSITTSGQPYSTQHPVQY